MSANDVVRLSAAELELGGRRPAADGKSWAISRRTLLKGAGALVVGFTLAGPVEVLVSRVARAQQAAGPQDVDAWLAIAADGKVTLFTGKVELGTGVETALAQIAAEELDVPFARLSVVQGDSERSPDQGPTFGSFSIANGGPQIQRAAAEARLILLQLASERLGAPTDQLQVRDGVVSVVRNSSRSVTYGQLVGGRRLEVEFTGQAEPKLPVQYTIVGQSGPRIDIPAKVTGTFEYVQNVRVPGMLHGRVVRPTPQSGATVLSVDEDSVRDVPGLVKVVARGNLVGVVAQREEHAIRAARQLKVTWSDPASLPAPEDLFAVVRNAPTDDRLLGEEGDVEAGLSGAARTVEATYEWPFQAHAMIGPSCAVADVRADRATVWSGTQDFLGLSRELTEHLELPAGSVRVIYTEGSGCYGRYSSDDAALDAAVLSQAVGRPVRVQWMREDEHGWDHYNTPMLFDLRGGLDANGNVLAWDQRGWSAQHFGQPLLGGHTGGEWVVPPFQFVGDNMRSLYEFPHRRLRLHALKQLPFRYGNNRSLGAVLSAFASESFMDELAMAAGEDPVEFRLRYLSEPRAIDAIQAAAERSGWETRPSPKRGGSGAGVATGRGIALGVLGQPPAMTWIATVAEVGVDRTTGEVRVTRFVVAHDCGLIINPDGLMNQVEGNTLQTMSRALFEEVTFDRSGVTSVDWSSYPILRFVDVPAVEVVLINRPDMRSSGAGEAATIPTAAAIGNAIFDATGARVRRVPFITERVRAALEERA